MSKPTTYSPKLKAAMDEIIIIFKKYDIAGDVALHTAAPAPDNAAVVAGFSEYLHHVTPSYSCLTLAPDGSGARVRAKAEDYPGGAPERDFNIAATANMVMHLARAAGMSFMLYENIEKSMEKSAGPFEHL